MPFRIQNANNLTFTIDGTILASEDNVNWPLNENKDGTLDFWEIYDSEYIHIRGSGNVDGQGYWWWMREYIVANKFGRPHLVRMQRVRHAIIEGVKFTNSAMFHLNLNDIDDFLI